MRNTKILLLDEAAFALHSESEREVVRLEKDDLTSRLLSATSTIQSDVIYVRKNHGKIVVMKVSDACFINQFFF